jgi:photosystem II stability/assembly factor-like uncharacterized protein
MERRATVKASPRTSIGLHRAGRLLVAGCVALTVVVLCAAPVYGLTLWKTSFVDPQTGWAMGYDPGSDGLGLYVLARTADGGASWTIEEQTQAFNGTGLDLGFVNASRGVWVNSWLNVTLDGGTTWRQRLVRGWGWGASLVDYATPSVVWVAGTYGSDAAGRCAARSTDGGRTWRTCLNQRTRPGTGPTALSAPTSRTAYLWSRGLLVTRNAGRTWNRVRTIHAFAKIGPWRLDFPTTKTGWALRSGTNTLLRTRDGGRHWVKQMPGLEQRFNSMRFISARIGWVTGAAGSVYRTVDGGANWSYHNVGTSDPLGSIDFIDSRHGWVVTTSSWGDANWLYRTSDGGETWEFVW